MLSDSSELPASDTTVRKLAWTSLALSVMAAAAAGTMVTFNIGYARGAGARVYKEDFDDLDQLAAAVARSKDASKHMLHKQDFDDLDQLAAAVARSKDAPKHLLHKQDFDDLDQLAAAASNSKDAPKHLLHKQDFDDLDQLVAAASNSKDAPKHLLHKQVFVSKMAADVQQAILEKHNELRRCHGAPPLIWNDDIASGAQEHADACDNQNLEGLCDHTPADQLGSLGENLASGDGQTGAPGVVSWYSERKDTENKEGRADENTPGTGHYTQVVWKGATEVGCGINEQQKYLICRYNAGNMAGEFEANVNPAVDDACDAALKDDGFVMMIEG